MAKYKHNIPSVLIPQDDICVPLHIPNHPDYVALVIRAIRLLTLDRNYDRDENHSAIVVRQQWLNRTYQPLIDAIEKAVGCFDCEAGDCEVYPSSASMITYSPQNPFSEPDLIPDGYLTPPFTRFANFPLVGWLATWFPDFTESLTGYLPDDIIVDISSLPSGSWSEPALGMPQIAIATSGNGIVELHMINFPLGGRAIVTIDVQPNVGDILGGILGNQEFSIELNRDIISIPPETVPVSIFEIPIEDEIPTNHTIYITFVPTVDDSLIPLNFGGGIRQVVFCGLDGVIMPIVEAIRLNNCQLEQKINGQWIAVGDVNACITAITDDLQAQITANDNDISGLLFTDADLQAQITGNLNNIASNVLAITNNANNISNMQDDIGDIQLSILGINAINIQQDNRLTALESKVSSSGSANFKADVKLAYNTVDYTNATAIYATAIESVISHEFTYDNALIIVEFKARSVGTNGTSYFRLAVAGQADSVNEEIVKTNVAVSTQCSEVYSGLKGQTLNVFLEFKAGTNTATLIGEQNIQYTILEWEGVPNNIVTFDNGGLPYTLVSPNTGVVSSGGNPGNCLLDQSVGFGDALGIEVDLGSSKQVNSVTLNVFSSDFPNTYITIYVGGVLAQQGTLVGLPNAWRTYQFNAGSFPLTGQTVRVFASPETGVTIADLRYDNIQINYE